MSEQTTTRRPATPEEMEEARVLIERALERGGAGALSNIRPLAFESVASSPNISLLEKTLLVAPRVNPLFQAVLLALGFDRSGSRSFAIGAGEDLQKKVLLSLLQAIPGASLRTGRASERVSNMGLDGSNYSNLTNEIYYELQRCAAGSKLSQSEVSDALWGQGNSPSWRINSAGEIDERWTGHSLVTLSSNGSQIHITVSSAWSGGSKGISFWEGSPDFNLLRFRGKRDPLALSPSEALAALETAGAWGFPVVDGGGSEVHLDAARKAVAIESVPGSPGRARALAPREIVEAMPTARQEEFDLGQLGQSQIFAKELASEEAVSFARSARRVARSQGAEVHLDERVEDIIEMRGAKAQGNRQPLRPYQDEAVSLHLRTRWGYVNACAPGLGKTLMALRAQREKSQQKKGYRSLVVCPAAIRSQWISEAARFFPEAKVATFTAKEIPGELPQFLQNSGSDPALVFLSYDAMRGASEILAQTRWDDLVCDEAAILGSTGTGRTQALWEIRRGSECAVALTGTPINKSLDDLGCIVAWVRGDETAFYGQKLSRRFDMSLDSDVEAMWDALGPTVFRRDRSEIADQLPHIDTEVLRIDPEPAELALARGAQDELRKIYDSLQKKLEIAESLRPDDPKLQRAREDMQKIRGAVLGGVTLARMAASDPGAVAARKGDSAGAALLDSSGLIEPAVRTGGTKRKLVCGLVEDLVGQGDAVLLFTDFSSVADNLAEDLRGAGVRVGTFTGKNSGKQREKAAADFQAGKLDCLVLTGAGREGLNLQRASVLVHYDLPWVPSQVVQRVGRASRFGSTSDKLQVIIPITNGTIEERVASILVPRAVEALRALDSHRGVDGSETEVGLAIGGLEEGGSAPSGQEGLFNLAREVLRGE